MRSWRSVIQSLRTRNTLTRRILSAFGGSLSMSASKKITVCVEGNIGSGKTTLLDHFAQFPDVVTLTEPVEKWRNVNGENLLDLMYSNPARWSCMFQSYVQCTMLDNHTVPVEAPIKMMERSIHSGRYCFVENLYQSGLLSRPEYAVLDQWFRWITTNVNVKPDLIVYLRSSPAVVAERIRRRARSEERAISDSYLRSLHDLHEDWLYTRTRFSVPCQVLVLDADKDMQMLKDEFNTRKHEILCRGEMESPVKDPRASRAAAI